MATTKYVTWKEYNGTDYDTLYPATVGSQISGLYTLVTANITTTWSNNTQTISVSGVKTNSVVEISLRSTATENQAKEFMALGLQDGGQSTNSITLKAYGTLNTANIPINIIIWEGM